MELWLSIVIDVVCAVLGFVGGIVVKTVSSKSSNKQTAKGGKDAKITQINHVEIKNNEDK